MTVTGTECFDEDASTEVAPEAGNCDLDLAMDHARGHTSTSPVESLMAGSGSVSESTYIACSDTLLEGEIWTCIKEPSPRDSGNANAVCRLSTERTGLADIAREPKVWLDEAPPAIEDLCRSSYRGQGWYPTQERAKQKLWVPCHTISISSTRVLETRIVALRALVPSCSCSCRKSNGVRCAHIHIHFHDQAPSAKRQTTHLSHQLS